jgi:hypothetical protein
LNEEKSEGKTGEAHNSNSSASGRAKFASAAAFTAVEEPGEGGRGDGSCGSKNSGSNDHNSGSASSSSRSSGGGAGAAAGLDEDVNSVVTEGVESNGDDGGEVLLAGGRGMRDMINKANARKAIHDRVANILQVNHGDDEMDYDVLQG